MGASILEDLVKIGEVCPDSGFTLSALALMNLLDKTSDV